MSQIILDMGSGNTCHNSIDYACKMIDAVVAIDGHKYEIIFKWQLFQSEPPNVPLDHLVFSRAYTYAKAEGYKTTSSVFDKNSLDFLLNFEIPFVKIACRPRLYWLIGEVPRKVPVYVSVSSWDVDVIRKMAPWDKLMMCVPEYPAPIGHYQFERDGHPFDNFSDHTEGLILFYQLKSGLVKDGCVIMPRQNFIWEKHFILEDDPKNPDAAGHAIKPDLLKEVIGA